LKSVFSSFIIKISKSLKRWSIEKRERERERERESIEKRKEKEKLQESLQIKREFNILRGEKYLNFRIFLCESIFSPSIIPFSKPF
jgi:hypothetical protein